MQFIAQNDSDKVVRAGAGFGLDHNRHAVCQNDAAEGEHQKLKNKGIVRAKDRCEQYGKTVDDRTAEDHAEDSADFDIAAVDKKQEGNDQKADGDMYGAVGNIPWQKPKTAQCAENSLHEHIERIGTEIRENKKGNAEVCNRQSDEKNEHPECSFFKCCFHGQVSCLLV